MLHVVQILPIYRRYIADISTIQGREKATINRRQIGDIDNSPKKTIRRADPTHSGPDSDAHTMPGTHAFSAGHPEPPRGCGMFIGTAPFQTSVAGLQSRRVHPRGAGLEKAIMCCEAALRHAQLQHQLCAWSVPYMPRAFLRARVGTRPRPVLVFQTPGRNHRQCPDADGGCAIPIPNSN